MRELLGDWYWAVTIAWDDFRWWVLRGTVCRWRGHRPYEYVYTSWLWMHTDYITFPDGEITAGPSVNEKKHHNTVLCQRCNLILGAAAWRAEA